MKKLRLRQAKQSLSQLHIPKRRTGPPRRDEVGRMKVTPKMSMLQFLEPVDM
jgi:hypothetical protein